MVNSDNLGTPSGSCGGPYSSTTIASSTSTSTTPSSNNNNNNNNNNDSIINKTTPPRHNYDQNPHLTPIASIKRPRSSLIGRNKSQTGSTPQQQQQQQQRGKGAVVPDNQDVIVTTPHFSSPIASKYRQGGGGTMTGAADASPCLSPMHGVRPVTLRDVHDISSLAVPIHEGDGNEEDVDHGDIVVEDEDFDRTGRVDCDDDDDAIHPAGQSKVSSSWIGQKVDALFSPVYQFLHHEEQEQKLRQRKHSEEPHDGIIVNHYQRSYGNEEDEGNDDDDHHYHDVEAGEAPMEDVTPILDDDKDYKSHSNATVGSTSDIDTQPTSSGSSSSNDSRRSANDRNTTKSSSYINGSSSLRDTYSETYEEDDVNDEVELNHADYAEIEGNVKNRERNNRYRDENYMSTNSSLGSPTIQSTAKIHDNTTATTCATMTETFEDEDINDEIELDDDDLGVVECNIKNHHGNNNHIDDRNSELSAEKHDHHHNTTGTTSATMTTKLREFCGETSDSDDNDDHSMGRPEHPTDIDEFNPWQFIKSLPTYDRISDQMKPPITLPPKLPSAPDKTLVLDLDETLVHCTVETPDTPADLTFPVIFHGMTYLVHVRLRPYLHEFFEKLVGKFEIVVFTASQKVYADELLNLIDPQGIYIQHRLFRESCLAVDGNFLKDLNVLGRDLSKTVLVDNSPHAFGYQVDNGIPIESWFDCPADRELLKLERFLRTLLHVHDVRPMVREKFQSYKLIEESPSLFQQQQQQQQQQQSS